MYYKIGERIEPFEPESFENIPFQYVAVITSEEWINSNRKFNMGIEWDLNINEITSTDPTEGADDINTLPDLPGGVLSDQTSLLNKYVEALQKNDREAAAKLFHPAILEAYDNDADAMLYDLDQHLSLYGGKISGWSTVDSGAVDQDDLNDLNESLPVGIENAEVHLIELQPEQGDAIEIFLLMVQTAEGWSLYYSY